MKNRMIKSIFVLILYVEKTFIFAPVSAFAENK